MMRFEIPGRLMGLNEYTRLCRANSRAANRAKKDQQELIALAAFAARVPKQTGPVMLSYQWYESDKRRDLDNVAFGQKFVQDALVAAGILKGDGWGHVVGFTHEFFVDKHNPRIEIELREVRP